MTKTAYLLGEIHGSEAVCLKEFEIWKDFYNRGLRHLFLEIPYFEAQFLNLWIKSKDDSVLDELWIDNKGTAGNSVFDREFFIKIKLSCPKTIFHGTDIGHAYNTTGKRYLESILPDSEEYRLALENIEQGRKYYEAWKKTADEDYIEGDREKDMVKNFIREFDSVEGDILGIYGEAHVFSEENGNFGINCNMCERIKKHYGDNIHIESNLLKNLINPISRSKILIGGKNYGLSGFGKIFTPFDESCDYIEIYRVDNSGKDFDEYDRLNNFIPEALYPCALNKNDVFLINSIKNGECVLRQLFVCDDFSEEYGLITTEINIEL